MSIEYVVDLSCPVKDAFSVEGMVRRIKGRNQANTILEIARSRGDTRPPDQVTFRRLLQRPGGTVQEEASVQTLLDEAAALDAHTGHCQDCPANVFQSPCGCYGSISYPIRKTTEAWLLSLFPDDLDTNAGTLLQNAVRDFAYDGGPFLEMRKSETFFEGRTPVERSWTTEAGAWKLDSNQALQMLFGVGPLQPSHCLMVSWFLGLIPHEVRAAEVGGFAGLKRVLAEREVDLESEDGQIRAFILFLWAVRAAAVLDVHVLIDM